MGDLVQFPGPDVEPEPCVVNIGSATITPTGHIRLSGDASRDEASRAIWRMVETQVRRVWAQTDIPRLRAEVQKRDRELLRLKCYLDITDPDWREVLKARQSPA